MIVSGGFNIYPVEIEKVIQGHTSVPDEKWGEAVCEDDLIALCKAQLGGAKAPKSVEFWLVLPRGAVGKLLKKDVRAKFWGDQWRAV